jgi:hypothetical protein
MRNYKYREMTEKIIGAAYGVHNTLESGFLEKVYQNYLKATGIEVGLLINFGSSVTVKRRIMNKNKSV